MSESIDKVLTKRLHDVALRFTSESIRVAQHVTDLRKAFEREDGTAQKRVNAVRDAQAYLLRIEAQPPVKTKAPVRV